MMVTVVGLLIQEHWLKLDRYKQININRIGDRYSKGLCRSIKIQNAADMNLTHIIKLVILSNKMCTRQQRSVSLVDN